MNQMLFARRYDIVPLTIAKDSELCIGQPRIS